MKNHQNQTGKNIVICLDGTGNQFCKDLTNIIKLYRMLEREPGNQVTYYDPGVGTIGDPSYKTATARNINKLLGQAFGRGVMKNVIEAYTYLMDQYEDGDKVFIFGFSRGAYTARVLAAFIKECGLLEKGSNNLIPYAKNHFSEKAPTQKGQERDDFFKQRSSFRSTYGRLLNRHGDPKNLKSKKIPNYQLRIHFLGLFDTVKSYGLGPKALTLRNEEENPSVLNVRHAISIDERRAFFPQMHWKASKQHQSCKEVWFAGVHSDVGGGYSEAKSGLSKIALEWMVHEAISFGMKVVDERYGKALQKKLVDDKWINLPSFIEDEKIKYAAPDPLAVAHQSLVKGWWFVQLLPKKLEHWEFNKSLRTITNEQERHHTEKELNPFLIHESALVRMADPKINYQPKNVLAKVDGDISMLTEAQIERTISTEEAFKAQEGQLNFIRLKI